jgi:hypothetical protein
VLVAATKQAKANIADLDGMAQLAIAESNQGFENSNLPIRLELAGTYVIPDYVESGTFRDQYARAKTKNDGAMDDLHIVRASTRANIVTVILNSTDECGRGTVNASGSSAFTVVGRTCAIGNYTFAHEIGHLLGAAHDEQTSTNKNYPYGYGYKKPGKWRTIMSYSCSSGGDCPRVNYWSSPKLTYRSEPLGDAAKHDNARVLEQRRKTAATWQ